MGNVSSDKKNGNNEKNDSNDGKKSSVKKAEIKRPRPVSQPS